MSLSKKRWLTAVVAMILAASPSVATASAGSFVPRVVLDPGHGGRYPGAVNCDYSFAGKECLLESDVNLDIALRASRILTRWGLDVALTRATDAAALEPSQDIETWNQAASGDFRFARDGFADVKDDLQARVNVGNCGTPASSCAAADPDEAEAFVSIHNNSCGGCGAGGTESYRYDGSGEGYRLAVAVRQEVVKRTRLDDRGTKEAAFYLLRWTRMPAVLLEGAFLDNDREAQLLLQGRFRARIATGVATGVARYFCDLRGTSGDDVLEGTSRSDVICALTGNDVVRGRGGDDTIIGGDGDDLLRGGRGYDLLAGGAGADVCVPGREDPAPETCEA